MYPIIKTIPLFSYKDFSKFSKDEAIKYLNLFLSVIPERISILEENVKIQYPNWKADYSKCSLDDLYLWLQNKVSERMMTQEEKDEIAEQLKATPLLEKAIPIPEKTMTDETISICFDAGIYFGETLRHNIKSLQWSFKLKPKNYIEFAQPILTNGMSGGDFNPRAILENVARGILRQYENKKDLVRLYDVWFDLLSKDKSPTSNES